MASEYRCTKEGELATLKSETKRLLETDIELKAEITELRKVYDLIYSLSSNVSKLTDQMGRNAKDVKAIKDDLDLLKNKDGLKYGNLMSNISSIILGLVLGYLFTQIFK